MILLAVLMIWIVQGASAEDAAPQKIADGVWFLVGDSSKNYRLVWTDTGLGSVVSIGSLADLVEVWLIAWLLREMTPIRFASRYLMIPL